MTRFGRIRAHMVRGWPASAAALISIALCASIGTAPAWATTPPARSATAVAGMPSFRLADIPMKDGVVLKADVLTPAPGTPGADSRGRRPLIVQPASWGQNDLEYVAQGRKLAADGYVVVTYTVRGFWLSGGRIDVGGPADVADISSVIDWALVHTEADPRRVGMLGLSLGAGMSLLGAAFDPRVKAVAALSAWGDLVDSLYSGQTRHLQAAELLNTLQVPTGRPGTEYTRTLADLYADRDMPDVVNWARKRSPGTYVEGINAHGTAVLLSNAWSDSIFNSSQITDFYQKLTVPKRLIMRPGDHATQELTGFLGVDNETWASAREWFDQQLKGGGTSGAPGAPVELHVRPGGGEEDHPSWKAVSSRTLALRLGRADAFGTGALDGPADTGWHTSITGGIDSGADAGTTELSGLLDQTAALPPAVEVPLLPRFAAAVWQSAPYPSVQRVRGVVRLHTTITSSASQGTVFAYLYDVNALGVGKLITHAPQSWSGRAPGQAFPLDIALFATAYDLPTGHRLALVLDTKDPAYGGSTPLGSDVSFSSPQADQSRLVLPLR
ncbi:CocE/NonD family hydrolase [Streptomyces sp. FXJ1.172]|uniref:CocE/NonD family hydrolase n=1 Tax=Streptomyces sp. FXJ1.172 TaxID=710705 RepID=UPI000ABC23FD|nr:CocE/NonD family hydrolase [Streptomyces sp. FXJ1.172]WEO93387.1 CocE/NonD family hydrolase [Streptomyces sp. FXJ1.172]